MMTIFEYTIKIIIVSVVEDITEARQFPVTVPSSIAPPNNRLQSGHIGRRTVTTPCW